MMHRTCEREQTSSLVVNQRRVREVLLRRQGGISDRQFARLLGVSATHYNHFRRGDTNFSSSLLTALTVRYPEVAEAFAADMQETASERRLDGAVA